MVRNLLFSHKNVIATLRFAADWGTYHPDDVSRPVHQISLKVKLLEPIVGPGALLVDIVPFQTVNLDKDATLDQRVTLRSHVEYSGGDRVKSGMNWTVTASCGQTKFVAPPFQDYPSSKLRIDSAFGIRALVMVGPSTYTDISINAASTQGAPYTATWLPYRYTPPTATQWISGKVYEADWTTRVSLDPNNDIGYFGYIFDTLKSMERMLLLPEKQVASLATHTRADAQRVSTHPTTAGSTGSQCGKPGVVSQ